MTPKLRILVAEDNQAFSGVLKFVLTAAGHDVSTVDNGNDAWMILQQQPFDLLITDCQMPGMDGLQLCRTIRADEALLALPIIITTAKGYEINDDELAEARPVALFFKPFSPRELVMKVTEYFQSTPDEASQATCRQGEPTNMLPAGISSVPAVPLPSGHTI